MTTPQTCSLDRLDSYLAGDLAASEESALVSHLDACHECREMLQARAGEDTDWSEVEELLSGLRVPLTIPIDGTPPKNNSDLGNRVLLKNVLEALGPTDDPEMLGRLGGYEVSRIIGSGGMGVVLKAHDRSLDRVVAIKVMSPHLASSGSARKRFAREAKAAAAVLHPNVIAIHSVAPDGELPYLVMPYLRGESLQKRLDREGPLPVSEILRIGSQAAAGLAAAHAQGLVHRDIKPANILLEDGVERVTITDFGLARAVDDATMTRSGVIAGTPQYMSPEQARGEPVDHRSDLFGLGSVLYTLCTGRAPFRAETTFGVLRRLTDEEPRPVRETNPNTPAWLCNIIACLMSKRREDRFESADAVSELLEGCLAHTQDPTSVSLPDRCSSLPRTRGKALKQIFFHKNTGVIAMVTTAVLALTGLIGLGVVATNPNDIGGTWKGDRWGVVALEQTKDGVYEGTYADAFGGENGKIKLKWSRLERRYKGSWSKDDKRCGKISIRRAGADVRGAWTTIKTADIDAPVPELAELHWTRYVPSPTPRAMTAPDDSRPANSSFRLAGPNEPARDAVGESSPSNGQSSWSSTSLGGGSGGFPAAGAGFQSTKNGDADTVIRCHAAGEDDEIVVQFIIDDGSHVKRGDLLVELDSSELESALNSKTIELATSEAKLKATQAADARTLEALHNDIAEAENRLAGSKVAFEAYLKGTRVLHEKQLQAIVSEAQDAVKMAQDIGADGAALRTAKSGLEVAQLKLENFKRFEVAKRSQELKAEISSAERSLSLAQNAIKAFHEQSEAVQSAQRSAIGVHQRRVEQSKKALQSNRIYAPHDGVVVSIRSRTPVRRGSTVRKWQKLLILRRTEDSPEEPAGQTSKPVQMEMLPTGVIVLRGDALDVKNAVAAFGSRRLSADKSDVSGVLTFRGVVVAVASKKTAANANTPENSDASIGPQVRVFAEDQYVGRLRENQSATVKIDAFPDQEFTGTVAKISKTPIPAIGPAGKLEVCEVTVLLASWPDSLKESMTATVELDAATQNLPPTQN